MNIKFTLSEMLFYIAVFFQITGNFFKQTQVVTAMPILNTFCTALVLLSIIVLIIKLIVDYKYDTMRLVISIVLGVSFLLVAVITQNMLLPISLFFFTVAINNVSFRRVVMISMTLLIVYMCVIHGLYLLGLLQQNNDFRGDGKVRYAVGYKFITFSSNFIFHILVMYLFIRQNKIKWIEVGILIAVTMYFYQLTDTRSALIFSLLTIGVIVVMKLFKVTDNSLPLLSRFAVKYSVLLGAIGSIGLTLLYSPHHAILSKLNGILTDRLRLGQLAFETFPIRWFGTPIEWVFYGDTPQVINNKVIYYLYADSSFVNMLLNYGVFMLLFVIVGFYLLGKTKRLTTIYFAVAISILSLHSMFDPQFLEILYNPFVLSIGYLFGPAVMSKKCTIQAIGD